MRAKNEKKRRQSNGVITHFCIFTLRQTNRGAPPAARKLRYSGRKMTAGFLQETIKSMSLIR